MNPNSSIFTINSYRSCSGIMLFADEFPELTDNFNFIIDTNYKSNKQFSLAVYDLGYLNTSNPNIYFQSYCSNGQPAYSSASTMPFHNYNNQIIKDWDTFLAANAESQLYGDASFEGFERHRLTNINYSSMLFYGNNYNQSMVSITGLVVTYFAVTLAILRLGSRSLNSYTEEKNSISNDRRIYSLWKNARSSNKESTEKTDTDRGTISWVDKFDTFLVSSHLRMISLVIICILTFYIYTYLMIVLLYETIHQVYSEHGSFSAIETLHAVWRNSKFTTVNFVLKMLCFNHFLIIILPTFKKGTCKTDYWSLVIGWTVFNVAVSVISVRFFVSETQISKELVKYSKYYLKDYLDLDFSIGPNVLDTDLGKDIVVGYGKVLNKLSNVYSTSSLILLLRVATELVLLAIYMILVTIKVFINPSSFFLTLVVNKDKERDINSNFFKSSNSQVDLITQDNIQKHQPVDSVLGLSNRHVAKIKASHAELANLESNNRMMVLNPKAAFLSLSVVGLAIGQLFGVAKLTSTTSDVFIINASISLYFVVSIVSFNMYTEYMSLLKGINEVSKMKEDFLKSYKLKDKKNKKKDTECDELRNVYEDEQNEIFLQELIRHTELSDSGAYMEIIDDMDLWGVSKSTSTEPNLKTYYYNLTEE